MAEREVSKKSKKHKKGKKENCRNIDACLNDKNIDNSAMGKLLDKEVDDVSLTKTDEHTERTVKKIKKHKKDKKKNDVEASVNELVVGKEIPNIVKSMNKKDESFTFNISLNVVDDVGAARRSREDKNCNTSIDGSAAESSGACTNAAQALIGHEKTSGNIDGVEITKKKKKHKDSCFKERANEKNEKTNEQEKEQVSGCAKKSKKKKKKSNENVEKLNEMTDGKDAINRSFSSRKYCDFSDILGKDPGTADCEGVLDENDVSKLSDEKVNCTNKSKKKKRKNEKSDHVHEMTNEKFGDFDDGSWQDPDTRDEEEVVEENKQPRKHKYVDVSKLPDEKVNSPKKNKRRKRENEKFDDVNDMVDEKDAEGYHFKDNSMKHPGTIDVGRVVEKYKQHGCKETEESNVEENNVPKFHDERVNSSKKSKKKKRKYEKFHEVRVTVQRETVNTADSSEKYGDCNDNGVTDPGTRVGEGVVDECKRHGKHKRDESELSKLSDEKVNFPKKSKKKKRKIEKLDDVNEMADENFPVNKAANSDNDGDVNDNCGKLPQFIDGEEAVDEYKLDGIHETVVPRAPDEKVKSLKKSKKKKRKNENFDDVSRKEKSDVTKLSDEKAFVANTSNQWEYAQFSSAGEKEKFLRLMGAYKSSSRQKGTRNYSTLAMNRKEENAFASSLEKQFFHAKEITRGAGLGFQEDCP